jgi:hypothetical protein
LRALLADDATPPDTARATADQVREWNATLAAQIRAGSFDDRFDDLIEMLSATVNDKLAIANPRWA